MNAPVRGTRTHTFSQPEPVSAGVGIIWHQQGGTAMSGEDKVRNVAERAKGKVKETAGKAVGNKRLTAEGKADQVSGDAKQAGEKIKDVFKH